MNESIENKNYIHIKGRPICGALFDIDGTLIDSMPIWRHLGERYLRSLGVEPEPGLGDILWPMTAAEGAEYLRHHYHLSESLEEVSKGLTDQLARFYREEVSLKPGVRTCLDTLARNRIPMLLTTVGMRELEEAALRRLGVRNYFGEMLCCEDFKTSKRTPDIYLEGAGRLKLPPEQILVVEDVYTAIHSAHSAGFFTVAVQDGESRDDWERMKAEADLFLPDVGKIPIDCTPGTTVSEKEGKT